MAAVEITVIGLFILLGSIGLFVSIFGSIGRLHRRCKQLEENQRRFTDAFEELIAGHVDKARLKVVLSHIIEDTEPRRRDAK